MQKLLIERKSVAETAMLLNFSTSSYFSTVFKNIRYIHRKTMYAKCERLKGSSGHQSPEADAGVPYRSYGVS